MPELPEVESFRRHMEKSIQGHKIKNIISYPDEVIFRKKSAAFIRKVFLGAKVKKCLRKGKYIWFETTHTYWPVFHLGMTGSFIISRDLPEKMKSVKLVLEMDDGTKFVFKDPRRFGRIFLLEDPLHQKPLSQLGPDALNEPLNAKELGNIFQGRKAPVKALLMDQSLISGIGNWMADEIYTSPELVPLGLRENSPLQN